MRLVWKPRALRHLEAAADWSPKQAMAVVDAVERMVLSGWSLGRPVGKRLRWLPVPPLAILYDVRPGEIVVVAVIDVRRLRNPPP